LTVFCSAAREFLEFATQIDRICFAAFWNLPTKQLMSIVLPCSEKRWNLPTKATQIGCFFGLPRTKILEFADTRATQIDCILFCQTAKTFGFDSKNNSN
jgi:hypothetical protein